MDSSIVPSVFDELAKEQTYFEYATTGQRFVNLIVDTILYYVLTYIIGIATAFIMMATGVSSEDLLAIFGMKAFNIPFATIIYLLVFIIMEGASKGRSLGKLLTRTVAVKQDFSKISWKDALNRSLCRLIPFDALSALGGNPWHDRFSKTTVIKKTTPKDGLIY